MVAFGNACYLIQTFAKIPFVFAGTAVVLKYLVKGLAEVKKLYPMDGASGGVKEVLSYLEVVDTVKHSTDEHQVARLVEQHRLQKEHLPTSMAKSKEVRED